MADLAACSITADALRWHAGLPDDVTSKWRNLQSALLSRYTTATEKYVDSFKILNHRINFIVYVLTLWLSDAPSPPAAAPPDYGTLSRLSNDRGGYIRSKLRVGVVRVVTPELTTATYLCEELNSNGRVTLTRSIDEALQVCFAPSKHLHNIHTPVCGLLDVSR